MNEIMVLGERCADIADELVGMSVEPLADGTARCEVRMRADGPLVRALYRAEAELLLTDAADMAEGSYTGRTPDQRRADALVELVSRLTDALAVGGADRAVPDELDRGFSLRYLT